MFFVVAGRGGGEARRWRRDWRLVLWAVDVSPPFPVIASCARVVRDAFALAAKIATDRNNFVWNHDVHVGSGNPFG